jgi:hypothetical protein
VALAETFSVPVWAASNNEAPMGNSAAFSFYLWHKKGGRNPRAGLAGLASLDKLIEVQLAPFMRTDTMRIEAVVVPKGSPFGFPYRVFPRSVFLCP